FRSGRQWKIERYIARALAGASSAGPLNRIAGSSSSGPAVVRRIGRSGELGPMAGVNGNDAGSGGEPRRDGEPTADAAAGEREGTTRSANRGDAEVAEPGPRRSRRAHSAKPSPVSTESPSNPTMPRRSTRRSIGSQLDTASGPRTIRLPYHPTTGVSIRTIPVTVQKAPCNQAPASRSSGSVP